MFRLVVLGVLLTTSALGQKFEVATIKLSDPNAPGISVNFKPRGTIVTGNTSLRFLITWAWDIRDDRLVGQPKWLDTVQFDVVGKSPDPAVKIEQIRAMMQSLLTERFGLALHREARELPLFALLPVKGGPKVTVTPASNPPVPGGTSVYRSRIRVTDLSLADLAKTLSGVLGQSVVDATGLAGVFSGTLEWAPDTNPAGEAPEGPSIFTAIQEQFGLKLEARKGPVEVLVIDHVEQAPTEN